jgi:hypothetical protein
MVRGRGWARRERGLEWGLEIHGHGSILLVHGIEAESEIRG